MIDSVGVLKSSNYSSYVFHPPALYFGIISLYFVLRFSTVIESSTNLSSLSLMTSGGGVEMHNPLVESLLDLTGSASGAEGSLGDLGDLEAKLTKIISNTTVCFNVNN